MLKIKVEGYQEAKDILDELPNRMQKQMLRSALKKSSKPFVTQARRPFTFHEISFFITLSSCTCYKYIAKQNVSQVFRILFTEVVLCLI